MIRQGFAALLEPSLHIGSSFDIGIDNGSLEQFFQKDGIMEGNWRFPHLPSLSTWTNPG